ncbi:YrhK family protein [Virgibacillus siamensis]|uniref:YrhK family protein n=1 Tax=Virgibacillus siamensis TaxID=480071 RepID=UPI0036396511
MYFVGSFLFYYKSLEELAITLFIIGSAQMAIGLIIRLAHKIHKKEIETKLTDTPSNYNGHSHS